MSALTEWAPGALAGATVLMLFVLAVRAPARHWIGPKLAYALWALPALRMVVPSLPADLFAALPTAANGTLSVLAIGAGGGVLTGDLPARWQLGPLVVSVWLAGTALLLAAHIARHFRFRRRLLASATTVGRHGAIRVVAADVDGPLAFGVFRRTIAVPRNFAVAYDAAERELALAHEAAHHARGDLAASWVALAVLAAHWWNPVAWLAVRAFREDQEFAVDAQVLEHRDRVARSTYARVLARAAGVGALPVCTLNARCNLKGRLMLLTRPTATKRRLIMGGGGMSVLAATALIATLPATSTAAPGGNQATTIGVKPDGTGGYALIVGGVAAAPGAPLPGGATLPVDLDAPAGCDLKPSAKPRAMVIKGSGGITTYSVMCASAKPASVKATLVEGLASLKTMRGSVATQAASAQFPETERTHALGAIDRSIREVEATLAAR